VIWWDIVLVVPTVEQVLYISFQIHYKELLLRWWSWLPGWGNMALYNGTTLFSTRTARSVSPMVVVLMLLPLWSIFAGFSGGWLRSWLGSERRELRDR